MPHALYPTTDIYASGSKGVAAAMLSPLTTARPPPQTTLFEVHPVLNGRLRSRLVHGTFLVFYFQQ